MSKWQTDTNIGAYQAIGFYDGTEFQVAKGTTGGAQLVSLAAPAATSNAATYTDKSSTIATGGTQQTFAAANTSRRGYRVQNLSSTNLYINDKGSNAVTTQTGSSFTLVPGAMYESSTNGVSVSAISIIGATTSQAFEGAEW